MIDKIGKQIYNFASDKYNIVFKIIDCKRLEITELLKLKINVSGN